YVQALRRLAAQWEREGDLDQATHCARRAIGADPLREELHQNLMRLFCAAGQPSAALHQYRELERLLSEELGQAPSAASCELARKARGQCSAAPDLARTEVSPAP